MKIALGCDHGGLNLKAEIAEYLKSQNIKFKDQCDGDASAK